MAKEITDYTIKIKYIRDGQKTLHIESRTEKFVTEIINKMIEDDTIVIREIDINERKRSIE